MTKATKDTRSAVTGRKIGKHCQRSIIKNACYLKDFYDSLESPTLASDLAKGSITLGKVTRNLGADRLQVIALTFDSSIAEETSVRIRGTLQFHGRSSTKTDLAHCMYSGDVIIIDGGLASAKLTQALASEIAVIFKKNDIFFPKGFFSFSASATTATTAATAIATEDDEGDELFDYGHPDATTDFHQQVKSGVGFKKGLTEGVAGGGGGGGGDDDSDFDIDAI